MPVQPQLKRPLQLIYLPTTPTPALQSLSAPLLNFQDTHASAPFFGPNFWEGVLIPVPGGGIPPQHTLVQLKLTFKDGGAFDFSSTYERIKETLSQALDVARESGRPVGNGAVDVDLEQLPAYEEGAGGRAAPPQLQRPTPIAPNGVHRPRQAPPANNGVVGLAEERSARPGPPTSEQSPPDEPPPGYDEVQQASVANILERSVDEKR